MCDSIVTTLSLLGLSLADSKRLNYYMHFRRQNYHTDEPKVRTLHTLTQHSHITRPHRASVSPLISLRRLIKTYPMVSPSPTVQYSTVLLLQVVGVLLVSVVELLLCYAHCNGQEWWHSMCPTHNLLDTCTVA